MTFKDFIYPCIDKESFDVLAYASKLAREASVRLTSHFLLKIEKLEWT